MSFALERTHTTIEVGQICLGRICNVLAKCIDKPSAKYANSDHRLSRGRHELLTFNIVRSSLNRFSLCFVENIEFADINLQIGSTFEYLNNITKPFYEAVVRASAIQGIFDKKSRKQLALTFEVDVLICCPSESAFRVGQFLSERNLFLQRPRVSSTRPYKNPHVLGQQSPQLLNAVGNFDHVPQMENIQPEDMLVNAEQMLDNLPKHDYLQQCQIDNHVITDLRSDQREGVDFVNRKELSQHTSSHTLWRRISSNEFDLRYKHAITGTEITDPPEGLAGGIIADEMGLGKTLMMLAVVAGSLGRANMFGQEHAFRTSQFFTTKTTLVIVPSETLLKQWIAEINKHLRANTLRWHKYHGPHHEIDNLTLSEMDVVLTTYATAANDKRGFLHQVAWFRVILDEGKSTSVKVPFEMWVNQPIAHEIRTLPRFRAQRMLAFEAKHRWCLTGTPIQNKIQDVEALVRFLHVPIFEQPKEFRSHIVPQAPRTKPDGFQNLRLLLGSICLRRMKKDIAYFDHINATEQVIPVYLTAAESEAYSAIFETYRDMIRRAGVEYRKEYKTKLVIQMLLRLRIFCNSGTWESARPKSNLKPELGINNRLHALSTDSEPTCVRCLSDIIIDTVNTIQPQERNISVSELLCGECKGKAISEMQCTGPDRTESFTSDINPSSNFNPIDESQTIASTKLKMLLADLSTHGRNCKSLIFSSWTRTLDIVEVFFKQQDFKFLRFDGSISNAARWRALQGFSTSKDISALLMTIGSGGEGLSIEAANRVYLLEPHWNPAAEKQAIGRVLRPGQMRDVTVVRFIVKKTIEEHVQDKQKLKLYLAEGGLEGLDGEELEKCLV